MRTSLTVTKVSLLVMFLLCVGTASALPISSCSGPDSTDFTCNLYPSDNFGFYSGDTFINFPAGAVPTTPGFLVLLFPGDVLNSTNEANQSDWEQVIEYMPDTNAGTGSNLIQLWTNGCTSGTPGDVSCFPSVATVQAGVAGTPSFYDNQCSAAGMTQGDGDICAGAGIYNWFPDEGNPTQSHQYFIYTLDAATGSATPEPGSIGLLLLGASGLFAMRRRFVR
ncbi:MAG TPA: PEP-CTERM sorting domain-containing protein [Bryobacteraceae bacterium]